MGLLNYILVQALTYYSFLIIIYIFMSWVPGARESQIGLFIGALCEPFLAQFRKIIPPLGMIDISPLVAIIALNFARTGIDALFNLIG